MSKDAVAALVERLVRATTAAGVELALLPGVSEAEVDALQEQLGVELPEAYRALLRLHGGQRSSSTLYDANSLMAPDEVRRTWTMMVNLLADPEMADCLVSEVPLEAREVRRVFYDPAWVPVLHNGGGDLLCIDLAPGPTGTAGQILSRGHEEDHRERAYPVVASSLVALLELVVTRWEE